VLEVEPDRAIPVDVGVARPVDPRGPVERAGHGGLGLVGDAAFEVVDDLAHHLAGDVFGLVGHDPVEREQRAHEVDVGLDGVEHLRLQEQAGEVEPLDRVRLHDLHDRAGEVLADVAQPARDLGRRRTQAGRALPPAPLPVGRAGVVERRHRRVHRRLVAAELAQRLIGRAAEHQPPPARTLIHAGSPARAMWTV
jgi:hypothetical protein